MSITPAQVKDLREKTGAGMMNCKKALSEAGGDMEKAHEILRKKGISLAAKKQSRVAAEGIIGRYFSDDGTTGVLLEVNCETDFVTKTPDFTDYVKFITGLVKEHDPQDIEVLLAMSHNGSTIKDLETQLVAKIGEKLGVRRFVRWAVNGSQKKLAQYIHAGDKIGVMVSFNDPSGKLDSNKAKDVAMHIAAMSPQYVKREDIPGNVLEKEKEIIRAQIGDQKKPPEILEKIVNGKLQKFCSDICLNDQIFVRDPDGKLTVAKALKQIDPAIEVKEFVRFQVGEGIEKK